MQKGYFLQLYIYFYYIYIINLLSFHFTSNYKPFSYHPHDMDTQILVIFDFAAIF